MQPITEKNGLFGEIACFYGKTFSLPPLAAKIYTLLLFDFDRQGITFDELLEKTSASKSSVSENLKILSEKHLVVSRFGNSGRKRYFFVNDNHINIRFEDILERLQKESEIIAEFIKIVPENYQELIGRLEVFRNMLDTNYQTISKSLKKL